MARWTDDNEDAAAAAAQRKQEKEEKKRLKARKAATVPQPADQQPTPAPSFEHDAVDRPSKRRKTSAEPNGSSESYTEGADLLQFRTRTFGPCQELDKYAVLNDISEGSYGLVSRGRTKATGEVVALKQLKMEYTNDGFPVTGLREIQTLMACKHRNVVNLREVIVGEDMKDIFLVLDFHEHDLKTLLEDMAEPFLPSEIKTLMLQIASALDYLHSNWILHRDLKTSNILLNNRGELKLADFGMARYTGSSPPKLTQLVVTLWYRAPELLLGTSDYGSEIDVWSMGCVFAELLTKDPLFQGKNEVDQLSKVFALLGTPTNESWPGFRSLPNAKALHPVLSKTNSVSSLTTSRFPYLTASGFRLLSSLLSLNPADRPAAEDVSKHSYFEEKPKPKAKEMFPTFPSKAGQEKRRRRATPQAPVRGDAPKLEEEDFAGIFAGRADEEQGAGFALRLG